MELSQLLSRLENDPEKTASAEEAPEDTQNALKSALNDALDTATAETEKVASAENGKPENALFEKAAQLAEAEKSAELEHAKLLGLAFADAAITKWAAFDAQLKEGALQMQAQEQVPGGEAKVAAEQGYSDTLNALQGLAQNTQQAEKIAADEYTAGQEAALTQVQEAAATEFIKGAAETRVLLDYHRSLQNQ